MRGAIADIGLVHGAGFEVFGEQIYVSDHSRAQAIAGARLLEDGRVNSLILSGCGLPGVEINSENTEAKAMHDFLVSIGVPSSSLILEGDSTSLLGNWVNSAMLADEMGYESILGVARPLTLPRAYMCGRYITRRVKPNLVGYTVSHEPIKPTSIGRELLSISFLSLFLAKHRNVPVEELADLYEALKNDKKVNDVKRWRYSPKGSSEATYPEGLHVAEDLFDVGD